MVQFAEIYDPKTHIETRMPIHLIYKEGDILLMPVSAMWDLEQLEEFKKYIKREFPEFKDIRLVPNMICCQVLRKAEDICLDDHD